MVTSGSFNAPSASQPVDVCAATGDAKAASISSAQVWRTASKCRRAPKWRRALALRSLVRSPKWRRALALRSLAALKGCATDPLAALKGCATDPLAALKGCATDPLAALKGCATDAPAL